MVNKTDLYADILALNQTAGVSALIPQVGQVGVLRREQPALVSLGFRP